MELNTITELCILRFRQRALWSQHHHCVPGVNTAENDFLYEKTGHLNFLHCGICGDPSFGGRCAIRRESEHFSRSVQRDAIGHDHPKDPAVPPSLSHEIEPGV